MLLILELVGPCYYFLLVWDLFFCSNNASIFWQKRLENIASLNYPRIIRILYKIYTYKDLNLDNPKSFNELMQWIKIYDNSPLKTELTDKYLVREWISKTIGSKYLIPLLGVWDRFDEIDFASLPDAFVLKCNHGCFYNLVVKNKRELNLKKTKRIFDKWMKTNFAFNTLELQYRDIPRKIIAEKYVEQIDGKLLDYKIHVFHGEPKIIQVIGDRNFEKHTAKECFFTTTWEIIDVPLHTYNSYDYIPPKPDNLNEMLSIARTLGKEFRYVRVDLYDLDGEIKFGEMTFTPASGYARWGGEGTIFSKLMNERE